MSLRDAIASLPDTALVPVGWVREQLGEGEPDSLADLTVEQVAAELNRAVSTIRGWLGAGDLRGYRMNGREWRVPPAALREFREIQRNGKRRSSNGSADLAAWRDVE